jgi:hypothetical protein
MTAAMIGTRACVAAAAVAALLAVGGCVTVPTGPAVAALPGQYKPWDQFRIDDAECRQFASAAIGPPSQSAVDASAANAIGASALGAAAGAILGSVTGQAGQGAAVGAGMGLLFGSAAGSNVAYASSYQLQKQYDGAYLQCMYAKGNQVPMRPSNRLGYRNAPGPAGGAAPSQSSAAPLQPQPR